MLLFSGTSPEFGDSTDKSLCPSSTLCHQCRGTAQERSEGHSPALPAPLPSPLLPLRPLLLPVPAAGVTVGSVCPVLVPHCALQPPFPSLLLFLSASLSPSLPLPRLKWIMRSLITKTWQLFPRLKPSMKCSVLTSFPTSPITDTRRMRRWRDIAMGRYRVSRNPVLGCRNGPQFVGELCGGLLIPVGIVQGGRSGAGPLPEAWEGLGWR